MPVLQASATRGDGVEAFWQALQAQAAARRADGRFDARRSAQREAWLWDIVHARLRADFENHPAVRAALVRTLADVNASRAAPTVAARALLGLFEKD
jgi:LAO/AO transport system kinase